MGDVSLTIEGDVSFAAGAEPGSIVYLATTRAAGAVPMVTVVASVA